MTSNQLDKDHAKLGGALGSGVFALLGAVVGAVLAMVGEIIAARYVGIRFYGFFAIALTVARSGAILAAFGIPIGVLHFIPNQRNGGQVQDLVGTVFVAIFFPLLHSALFIAALSLLTPWLSIAVWHEPQLAPYLWLGLFLVPLMSLAEVLAHLSRGFGYTIDYVLTRSLLPQVGFFALLLVVVLVQASPLWVIAAYAGGYLAATCFGLGSVLRALGLRTWRKLSRLPVRTMYVYCAPLLVNGLAYTALVTIDVVMLGIYYPADEVGVYRGCLRFVFVFQLIITAFNAASANVLSVLSEQSDGSELKTAYNDSTRWMSIFAAACLTLIGVAPGDLLSLLGPSFAAGVSALLILTMGEAMRACMGNANFVLIVSGRQRLETLSATSGVILNLVLNFALIPYFGIVGAAVATLASHLLMNAMRFLQIRREFNINAAPFGSFMILLLAIAIVIVVTVLGYLISMGDGSGFVPMLVRLLLAETLLAACLWYAAITPGERRKIMALLRRGQGDVDPPSSEVQSCPHGNSSGNGKWNRQEEFRPDFFIVGAPKSGTTALAQYLNEHPQIFMPAHKDVHFFGSDLEKHPSELYVVDDAHYQQLYTRSKGALRKGEASVGYLYSKLAAAEIHKFNPQAQIIIMLRNPVDVMYSSHSQVVWLGYEDIFDFEGALRAEEDRLEGKRVPAAAMMPAALHYRNTARFTEQVRRYFDVFGREKVHVIIFDDFKRDAAAEYLRTLEFLGVEPFLPPTFEIVNPNKFPRSAILARMLHRPPAPFRWLRNHLPHQVRFFILQKLLRLNTKVGERKPMPANLRETLLREFSDEIDRLGELVGRDLSHWKNP